MTALTVRKTYNMPLGKELVDVMEFCKCLASAPFYQKIGPGGVLAIYLTAKELGLPLMSSLNGGLYTFDGKVTMSAQMMNLMIINAGHFLNIIHDGEDYCEIQFERSDRPGRQSKFTYKYTIEDAAKAGYLHKDNWKKHTRAMLVARTISGGGRIWMPDVFLGIYAIGELDGDSRAIDVDCAPVHQTQASNPIPETFGGEKEMEYIRSVAVKTGWTKERIIDWAIKNTDQFNEKFEKWKIENAEYLPCSDK